MTSNRLGTRLGPVPVIWGVVFLSMKTTNRVAEVVEVLGGIKRSRKWHRPQVGSLELALCVGSLPVEYFFQLMNAAIGKARLPRRETSGKCEV